MRVLSRCLIIVGLALPMSACGSERPEEEGQQSPVVITATEETEEESPRSGHPGFERLREAPPGMLSRKEAVRRSRHLIGKAILEFNAASAKFGRYTLPAVDGEDLAPPVPAWKVKLFGSFKGGPKNWMVIIHAGTGVLYESSPG